MPKLDDGPLTLTPFRQTTYDNQPRYGRILAVLVLVLLLLAFLYWQLTKPPAPIEKAESPGISHMFSIYGWGRERLKDPNGVAVDKSGNVYIADTAHHRVAVFNSRGRYKFSFGNKDADKVEDRLAKDAMVLPLNVAVDDNFNIYVTSSIAGKLSIFDSRGKFKSRVMIPGIIKILAKGNKLYATTPGELLIMNLKGKVLKRIGSKGRKLGQFELPNGLAVDKKGNIFVSDSQNMRIQIFDKNGKLAGGIGKPPIDMNDGQRLFGLGLGLAMDDQENVYVVDAFHHAIRVFNHDGTDYGEYGKRGALDGMFNYPSDIAFAGAGVFVVADKWNDRVQVVRITPAAGGPADVATATGWPIWVWPFLILVLLVLTFITVKWLRGRGESVPARRPVS